ncbi:MAG: alpha-L-fucosidase [Prolixibacteraceae bacterium]|nr:alpha-L-fucosidase [Prolixibacteraceae bacterium]
MKKILLLLLISVLCLQVTFGQESKDARDKRMQWWREARFGMFIHWGPYAVWGGVYHGNEQKRGGAEWIMNRCKIPVAEYQQVASTFNPVKYDPESWVLLTKEAGMKYIVITAKHHDGFAMFKSNASKFNIADFTPYKKDVLEALAKACKKHNMKLGFYYSQAQDWNNPGGAVARKVAKEGWVNPDSARIDAFTAANKGHWDPAQLTSTMDEYIDRVAIPQVKELMTNYGEVAVLWWDTPTNMTDENALKLQALLKLQPNIITNDRLKRPNFPGDTGTPEQKIPGANELDGRDWETCMTMNGTWGFRTNDDKWKSPETLIRNLCDIASKGGNYLLNVGPDPLGQIPQPSIERLKAVGAWMKINGEAIYATKASPIGTLPWGRCTQKVFHGNTILYLSVFDWPIDGKLVVPGLTQSAISARILADGIELKSITTPTGMILHVPEKAPDAVASVIRVTLKGILAQAEVGEKK